MTRSQCPICNSLETETILALRAMPLFSHILHATRRGALETECAAMQLDRCRACGFIYNATFEPDRLKYSPGYENDLSVSPRFRRYATDLASELVQRYDLRDKDIIEIGCGNGHFLRLLCDMGQNRGVGFDPSYDPQNVSADRCRGTVEIVPDVYSARYGHRPVDMICCRQVLEHIADPLGFLRELRSTVDSLSDDCVLVFEVPNSEHTFLRGAIWDLLYEHCNYFTAQSLNALFLAAGFGTRRVDERFEGQFLTIEAHGTSGSDAPEDAPSPFWGIGEHLGDFERGFRRITDSWRERIETWTAQGRRVVAWGAGTKGTTFLNVLGLSHDVVEYIVDIHPHKQGRFVPGTGQEIVPPASLVQIQPKVVIVMNPTYSQEIQQMASPYVEGVAFVPASARSLSSHHTVTSSGTRTDINYTQVSEGNDEHCS